MSFWDRTTPPKRRRHEVTLAEAHAVWQAIIEGEGGACPCCGRFGKIYERQFNATMAKSLIWLANTHTEDPEDWVHVPSVAPKSIVRTNQLATTRWWGLIERMPGGGDLKTKHSGFWRTTRRGRRFSRGLILIPFSVFTYAGEVVRRSEELVSLEDTFATPFDYQQVMGEYGPEEGRLI